MGIIHYTDPKFDAPVPIGDFCDLDVEDQINLMREWFERNFEDPAENTPHITSEGGYFYLCGGPYDALDELTNEFGTIASETAIEKLAQELTDENYQWAGQFEIDDSDYDRFVMSSIVENIEFQASYRSAIDGLHKLLDAKVDKSVKSVYLQMLYVNVITTLETYLSAAFIQSILTDEKYIKKIVETVGSFREQKIPVSAIFGKMNTIQEEVIKYLKGILWHDLEKVSKLYKAVLHIDISEEVKLLLQPVKTRHDLVHRNGKTTEDTEVQISEEIIRTLVGDVESLVEVADRGIAKLTPF